jgi:hypothetical protein
VFVLSFTKSNHNHPIHPTNHSSDKEDAIRTQALKGRNTLAMGVAHRLEEEFLSFKGKQKPITAIPFIP